MSNRTSESQQTNEAALLMKRLYAVFILLVCLCAQHASLQETSVHVIRGKRRNVTQVSSIVHGVAHLPCDLTSPSAGDSPDLILWYRLSSLEPIYSVDARGISLNAATGWHSNERYSFTAEQTKSGDYRGLLHIRRVRHEDADIYRCRVDYRTAPAADFFFNLTIIYPPSPPRITDSRGKPLRSVIGPLNTGEPLLLSCIVHEGLPKPTVYWAGESGVKLASETALTPAGFMQSNLTIEELKRSHLLATFTCYAANNELQDPVSASITIDLNLPPLAIRMEGNDMPLLANRTQEVVCQVWGSRPPPAISWWLGSTWLQDAKDSHSPDGNFSTSILLLSPTRNDNGKELRCLAENRKAKGSAIQAVRYLKVHYGPTAQLTFGKSVNPGDVSIGEDVYLECKMDANPMPARVEWRHNGYQLRHNPKAGVIMSNRTLALQKATKESAGTYSCAGNNIIGSAVSKDVLLKVKYPPTCRSQGPTVLHVSLGELSDVRCEVDADPPTVSYHWMFNNTEESMEVPNEQVKVRGLVSTVEFTPFSAFDYGMLQCVASNAIGQQEIPCVFQIRRAEKPSQVSNCSLAPEASWASVTLDCIPGSDGGLPQEFHLEVYVLEEDPESSRLLANLTSAQDPIFTVRGLRRDRTHTMDIYSSNSKGRSDVVTLKLPMGEATTRSVSDRGAVRKPESVLFMAAIGSIGAGLVIVVVTGYCFVTRCNGSTYRAYRHQRSPEKQSSSEDTAALQQVGQQMNDPNLTMANCSGPYSTMASGGERLFAKYIGAGENHFGATCVQSSLVIVDHAPTRIVADSDLPAPPPPAVPRGTNDYVVDERQHILTLEPNFGVTHFPEFGGGQHHQTQQHFCRSHGAVMDASYRRYQAMTQSCARVDQYGLSLGDPASSAAIFSAPLQDPASSSVIPPPGVSFETFQRKGSTSSHSTLAKRQQRDCNATSTFPRQQKSQRRVTFGPSEELTGPGARTSSNPRLQLHPAHQKEKEEELESVV